METWERGLIDEATDGVTDLWAFAGCIWGPQEMEKIGKTESRQTEVPPLFYKIIILEQDGLDYPWVLAFLLPHHRSARGEIADYLVSVDIIEALSGQDFFSDLDDETGDWLEDLDTWEISGRSGLDPDQQYGEGAR